MTELRDRRIVKGVEFVGAVDGESGDAVRDLQRQEFERHGEVFVGKFGGIRRAAATAQIYAERSLLGDEGIGAEVDRP
ncbi:MAG: hypothetical protein NVSMB53_12600 [Gemmatimonadaceae bacterium]